MKNFQVRKVFFNGLFVLLGLMTSCSFLAYYISPADYFLFQWLGLTLPFLLIFHIILFFVGLFLRKWYAILAVVVLLANSHYFSAKLRWNHPDGIKDAPALRLMTYNVRQLKMAYNLPSAEFISQFIREQSVDIICLQEIPETYKETDLKQLFPTMSYCVLTDIKEGNLQLAILSKYPLDNQKTLSFDERPNSGLVANMTIGQDTIQIFNCHLQTTGWNLLNKDRRKSTTFDAFHIISDNMIYRSRQAEKIQQEIKKSTNPVIVCGDFNAPVVSYTYHTVKGKLQDAFAEAGRGYSYSYVYFRKLFRIDHVFYDNKKLQATGYDIGKIDYSDHAPILVDFNFLKQM